MHNYHETEESQSSLSINDLATPQQNYDPQETPVVRPSAGAEEPPLLVLDEDDTNTDSTCNTPM